MPTKPSITDENELLLQLRNGSKAAFETIYRQYYSNLYIHAYQKVRDRELAKDLVQDLFTSIWQKRESFEIQAKLSSYLYASIRNRIIDAIAKQRSQAKYLESLGSQFATSPEYADTALREKMLQEQIENALEQLPPRIREIFELSRKRYLSHKEISEQLNISEHTVRSYVKEALRSLRLKLGSFLWVLFIFFIITPL